jgi:hypothetical protein
MALAGAIIEVPIDNNESRLVGFMLLLDVRVSRSKLLETDPSSTLHTEPSSRFLVVPPLLYLNYTTRARWLTSNWSQPNLRESKSLPFQPVPSTR